MSSALRIQPIRLVMLTGKCSYCESTETRDQIIYSLFGIRRCNNHVADAKRDCNTWLRREKKVAFKDVPILEPYMATPITVKRASGVFEDDWTLFQWDMFAPSWICQIDGEWAIPVNKASTGQCKAVLVREILLPGLDKEALIKFLDEATVVSENERLTVPEEDPRIITLQCGGGRVARVFAPAAAAELEAALSSTSIC